MLDKGKRARNGRRADARHGAADAIAAGGMAWEARQPAAAAAHRPGRAVAATASVYVACNKANDIVEIDATTWT